MAYPQGREPARLASPRRRRHGGLSGRVRKQTVIAAARARSRARDRLRCRASSAHYNGAMPSFAAMLRGLPLADVRKNASRILDAGFPGMGLDHPLHAFQWEEVAAV